MAALRIVRLVAAAVLPAVQATGDQEPPDGRMEGEEMQALNQQLAEREMMALIFLAAAACVLICMTFGGLERLVVWWRQRQNDPEA
jgi:hypothetical protein